MSEHTDSIDRLYINAGVMLGIGPISDLASSVLLDNLNANLVGPHNIFRAFSPMVISSKASKKTIAVTSSRLSSLGDMSQWGPMTKDPYGLDHIALSCYAISK